MRIKVCSVSYNMSKIHVNEVMTQKFILDLNGALAMENSGIERLQSRIEEVSIPEAKQQMQHHLQESLEHQKRLQRIITSIGGEPTQTEVGTAITIIPGINYEDDD